MNSKAKFSFFLVVLAALLTLTSAAFGLERGANGWYQTGSGVRTKSIAFINVKVYAISHEMKELPASKSKQAVIDADVDKRFTWQTLRDLPCEKIQNAMREAFAMNHYSDQGKINAYVGACNKGELPEKTGLSISYNSSTKKTTIWIAGAGSATIAGVDFMKAVWSCWFGVIDQPALGNALIARL
jgi:hypothetical protein